MQFHPMSYQQSSQMLPTIPSISLNQPTLFATPQPQLLNNENYKLSNANKDSKIVYNIYTPRSMNNKIKPKETNYEVIIKSQK